MSLLFSRKRFGMEIRLIAISFVTVVLSVGCALLEFRRQQEEGAALCRFSGTSRF